MCSRVLWATNRLAVVVGRNMDWKSPMATDLWVLPRGIVRHGLAGPDSLTWTSKYGSLCAVTLEGREGATSDGMNERGLAGHALWLEETDYGTTEDARPRLSVGLWLQYYLDNFATVKEAVEFTRTTPYQIVTTEFEGRSATVHLALDDQLGDSAIIEFIDGKPLVYHGRQYTVMTNSPPFDQQLEQLTQYRGFGGQKPLPGTTEAADRFVRSAYYLEHLPEPTDYREAVGGVLSVMRNVSQPFGVVDPQRPNISPTRWRSVCDLTNGLYFFEASLSPNLIWARLDHFDFSNGASPMRLELKPAFDRVGDVSYQFAPAALFASRDESPRARPNRARRAPAPAPSR